MYNREFTPEQITALAENEIFVFGSNLAGKGAGGGGAGGHVGAVVDLKSSDCIYLTVGKGGAGGTKSSNAGASGTMTEIEIHAQIIDKDDELTYDSSYSAFLQASGGKGGNKAQSAGNGGSYYYEDYAGVHQTEIPMLFHRTGSTGAKGNSGTSTGSTVPTAATTYMGMRTAGELTAPLTASTRHFFISPIPRAGGADGSTASDSAGGGGGSLLGIGGKGVKQAAGTSGGIGAGGGGAGGQLIGGG
jgi:hypothetical protein